jgi:glycosyltransferase involved in cell wall biosynthesis
VFVMPSRFEGLSIAMLEAMSSALCVVAGRSPVGEYEALIDGATGLAVEGGSEDDLVSKLALAVSNPVLRTKIGSRARREIESRFSIQESARRTEQFLLSMLNDSGRP